jgi:molecular chaperone GrpE
MTPTDSTTEPETAPAAETLDDEAASQAANAAATDPRTDPAPPQDPLQQALQEAAQWKDLAYRNAAELDNFRKRATRDAQDARAYANAELLRSLFPILDNFEMGLDAARAESEKSVVFIGMSMVHRQLQEFLKDNGVQEIETANKPFDPNLHEAVAQEASDSVPEGTILRATRRGYKLKDRLLRAASVVVSSGPASA